MVFGRGEKSLANTGTREGLKLIWELGLGGWVGSVHTRFWEKGIPGRQNSIHGGTRREKGQGMWSNIWCHWHAHKGQCLGFQTNEEICKKLVKKFCSKESCWECSGSGIWTSHEMHWEERTCRQGNLTGGSHKGPGERWRGLGVLLVDWDYPSGVSQLARALEYSELSGGWAEARAAM